MRGLRTWGLAIFLVSSVIWFAGVALSQTNAPIGPKGSIDLTQIIIALLNLAFPIVAAVATYLINAHVKNHELATQLANAVQNGLGTVQQHATASLQQGTPLTLDTGHAAIAEGVQYVVDNAAEAISHFNIPRERIAEKLVAKVGLAAIQTNLAATGSSVPGISGPLAPVPAVHAEA